MKKISKDGKRIVRHEISKEEVLDMFKADEYKIDSINNMNEDTTFFKDYLSYYLMTELGLCTPYYSIVELSINNEHKGLYFLVENIEFGISGRSIGCPQTILQLDIIMFNGVVAREVEVDFWRNIDGVSLNAIR